MLDSLRARGLPIAFVDAGGDLALGDAPPGTDGWRVEFPGGEVHHLARIGVATSGDRYQFLEVEGVRYSHIVDPRTGLGVPDSPTVVVLAADATTADVLASALSVLDSAVGLRLVQAIEGVEARRTSSPAVAPPDSAPDAEATGHWQTEGFPRPQRRP
jgi:thiamine biosynthesis lipoprotein